MLEENLSSGKEKRGFTGKEPSESFLLNLIGQARLRPAGEGPGMMS